MVNSKSLEFHATMLIYIFSFKQAVNNEDASVNLSCLFVISMT